MEVYAQNTISSCVIAVDLSNITRNNLSKYIVLQIAV